MTLTNYSHGITSRGVPVLGGQRFDGWWGKTKFVDYDNGSDGNSGDEPSQAYKHLQTAIDACTINDVIYVRNREQDITSTDGETILPESTTNWSVAEAKTHLSIIGASNVSHLKHSAAGYAVILKGTATANTTAVLDIQAPFCLVENFGFHRGGSTSGGLIALTGNSTSIRALSSVVSNCLFRLYSNNTQAAIYNLDNWFSSIYSCDFHDCNTGIHYHGSNSTVRRNRVDGCIFRVQTAASVTNGIYFQGSNGQDNTVTNCDFVGETPTATDGPSSTAGWIVAGSAIQGTIVNCTFASDTVEVLLLDM